MTTVAIEPVRKQITVQLPQDKAFHLFTSGMGSWWNPTHSIGQEPIADVIIEARAGGRWYERGAQGTECDWGRVLVWEPVERVVLAWQITADWRHDPQLHTEVEVRFVVVAADRTAVELEHRNLDAYGEDAPMIRSIFDSPGGWPGLLDRYTHAMTAQQ